MDQASLQEESGHKDKLLDWLLSIELILPVASLFIVVGLVWAFLTRCGKRSCCGEETRIGVAEMKKKKSFAQQSVLPSTYSR